MSYEKPKLKSKHFNNLFNNLPSMEGKTVAITGTTSGTGFVAAQACGKLGARVLLLNRPSRRADAALNDLQSQNSNADFTQIDCDLQSFSSVREAAKNLRALCPNELDVLCNNAGVMALEDTATADGFDVQMQTNHLSHFLLTKLCFDLLEKAAKARGEARIVNHSSIARKQVKSLEAAYLQKNGGNLGGNGSSMFFGGGRWVRYGQTKLANATFTACLHEKLQAKGSKVSALVAHPGLAETDLQSTTVRDGGMGEWFTKQLMKMGQSREDGALGILTCITHPDAQSGQFYGPGMGGMFTALKGPATGHPLESSYDNPKTREILWANSCAAIGEEFNM
jgi:NAD(P)-dependent dehydrogenase (short-subunit alcohol dehydrogenase family)